MITCIVSKQVSQGGRPQRYDHTVHLIFYPFFCKLGSKYRSPFRKKSLSFTRTSTKLLLILKKGSLQKSPSEKVPLIKFFVFKSTL